MSKANLKMDSEIKKKSIKVMDAKTNEETPEILKANFSYKINFYSKKKNEVKRISRFSK